MNNAFREELLRRIDLLAEFQKAGGRVPPGAKANADGWIPVHSIDRKDEHPSAALNIGSDPKKRGIYVDQAATGTSAKSFFDLMAVMPGPFMSGNEVYNHFARETGMSSGEGKKTDHPAPTLTDIEGFQKNLTPEIKQFLREKRGLDEESLVKYRIGWCTSRERNTFPVFDETGSLRNIRFHNSKKKPKTLSWTGYGEARLWGLERLAKAVPGTKIIINEGELDAMLVEQETGLVAVSSTNGVKGFKPEWTNHFHGFHVVLLYDCDAEGREAVQNLILPAFKEAVEAGRVLSIKVVWLYDNSDKSHKDFTDWIVKDGGSGDALKKLIQETAPYTYAAASSELQEAIELASFTQIDQSKYAGQRVTVNLQVFGENTVAYYAATKIQVTSCQLLKGGTCNGPKGREGVCKNGITVPTGHRVQIAGVRATESQFKNLLRDFVCDKDKRPTLEVKDEDKVVIREVYAHQIFEAMKNDEKHQLDKPIYVIGGDLVGIGKYRATGRIIGSYRDQQPTLLVDTFIPQEEDYQTFDLDTVRPRLEKLKAMDVDEITKDLSYHVTRIYKRPDLHLGVLLNLCSPLWINFPGEGRIRGWLTAVMIGDTGTGKTTISQGIFEFARVGDRVSGLTSSRTGITYGMDHDDRKGWVVKAGALLKQSRQALIVDEAQDLPLEELKTMAEGLDTGLLKIDRIQHKTFESSTRTIFSCNPRDPKNFSDQKKMEEFRYGCQSVVKLFPDMMLRRLDLFLFAATGDIENKEEIFNPPEDLYDEPLVTADDLRALVFFAWNLKEDQVIIPLAVGKEIRKESLRVSKIYGCDSPPIVYPEDFRKTLARLSAAYAVLDLSTDEHFTQVIVRPGHVHAAADFVEYIYSAENCLLHMHADDSRWKHGLDDIDKVKKQIEERLALPLTSDRFRRLMSMVLRSNKEERLRKKDLADEFGVDKQTIQAEMSWFVKNRLVDANIQTGYYAKGRLFKIMARLRKIDPVKFTFNDLGDSGDSEGT